MKLPQRFQYLLAAVSLIGSCALSVNPIHAQEEEPPSSSPPSPGVSTTHILFGQSAAFEGPAASLGQGMYDGLLAAFTEANENGGVAGRQLSLVTKNDGYEPELAIANTRALIQNEAVFALIGGVGTPTSRGVLPIVNSANVPYIAPFTGAGLLRDADSYAVNLRASYDQETQRIVSFLTDTLGLDRIAIVYQDDSYGQAGFQGILQAMSKADKELAGIGTYPRNTLAVKTALLDIRSAEPQAVVIIGAYAPTAQLIHWAKRIGMDAVFITISFVGSQALADALGDAGEGVYVTQVVPTFSSNAIPVAADYRRALAQYVDTASPSFVSFEGYLAGRMTIRILEKIGMDVTRENFMATVREMNLEDLGGFELRFGAQDNQGSDQVYLTVIGPDGSYLAVSDD